MKDIENNIVTGHYKTVESFDADFTRLFNNVEVTSSFRAAVYTCVVCDPTESNIIICMCSTQCD